MILIFSEKQVLIVLDGHLTNVSLTLNVLWELYWKGLVTCHDRSCFIDDNITFISPSHMSVSDTAMCEGKRIKKDCMT